MWAYWSKESLFQEEYSWAFWWNYLCTKSTLNVVKEHTMIISCKTCWLLILSKIFYSKICTLMYERQNLFKYKLRLSPHLFECLMKCRLVTPYFFSMKCTEWCQAFLLVFILWVKWLCSRFSFWSHWLGLDEFGLAFDGPQSCPFHVLLDAYMDLGYFGLIIGLFCSSIFLVSDRK